MFVRRSSNFCYGTTFIVLTIRPGDHPNERNRASGNRQRRSARTSRALGRGHRGGLHLPPAAGVGMSTAERSRTIALVVLCTGMLMIVLDSAIVNVALEPIQSDLGFSQSSLAWVVNAYLIPFGGLLLLSGRLGDLIGRRSIFMTGLAVFTTASLACGAATSHEVLIAARF